MRNRLINLTFIALLSCCTTTLGCSDDEEPADAGTPQQDTGSDSSADVAPMTWADTMLRVTEVTITQPSGVGSILTGIINSEIRAENIHILIELSDFAATTGATTCSLHGDAGEYDETDSEYEFSGTSDEAAADITADGSFSNSELAEVDFPIRFTVNPVCDGGDCPNDQCRTDADCTETGFSCDVDGDGRCFQMVILPLHDVEFDGTLTATSGEFVVQGGNMDGLILKTDADEMLINLGGSTRILTEILGEANMDCPAGADPLTGWCITAVLNAEQVNNE